MNSRMPALSHQRAPIAVSLRAFEGWLESPPGAAAVGGALQSISQLADGFEVQFGHSDVLEGMAPSPTQDTWVPGWWNHVAKSAFSHVRQCRGNVGHLENLQHISPRVLHSFAAGLNKLTEATNIRLWTLHPVGVTLSTWRAVLVRVAPTTRLSIENMSPRSPAFARLEECAALLDQVPELVMTLDVCHLLQNGYALNSATVLNFIDTYRERIAVAHLSRPPEAGVRSGHQLLSGEYPEGLSYLLSALSPNTVLVTEGMCPYLGQHLVEEELKTLRLLTVARRLAA
jgi:hypothetical protein